MNSLTFAYNRSLRIIIIILLISSTSSICAQTIYGRLVNINKSPIAYASIIILNSDSTFIAGKSTDIDGKFEFSVKNDTKYLLKISLLGYKMLYQNCMANNLGDITLSESAVNIKEVVITSQTMEQFADKKTYRFTAHEKERMRNSLDVLSLIPTLNIGMDNKLNLKIGGKVKILLNGVNADETDLSVLKQDEILKIDYYENPPAQYAAMGLSAVINIITKKQKKGGSVGLDLQNGLTTIYGNNVLGAKYNFNNSQIGIKYDSNIRRNKKFIKDELLDYNFDNINYKKDKQGIESPYRWNVHNLAFSFNNQKQNNYLFSAIAGIEFQNRFMDCKQNILLNDKIAMIAQNQTDDKYIKPSLDLYFSKSFHKEKTLIFNVTGSYFKTDYTNRYNENGNKINEFKSYTDIDGHKYSIISNAIYSMKLSQSTLSFGARDFFANSVQNLSGDNTEKLTSYSNDFFAYIELIGRIKKLNYQLSTGLNYSNFDSQQLDRKFSFTSIRPSIRLNYKMDKQSILLLIYEISTTNPNLSQLSETPIMLDNKYAFYGNSELKPFNTHSILLGYNYNKDRFYAAFNLNYKYAKNPILPYFKETSKYIAQTYDNLKSSNNYIAAGVITYYPFSSKWLYLSIIGQLQRTEINGLDFSWSYNDFRIIPSIKAFYKKFGINLFYQSSTKQITGQLMRRLPSATLFEANYHPITNMSLTLGWRYPFYSSYKEGSETHPSSLVYHYSNDITKDYANMIYCSFSYNFSIGSLFKESNKKTNNLDSDSGILKSY